jgi:hypothetical protein
MKYLIFILIASLSLPLMGQFTDDFTDGDFTNNPAWGGETDKFTVNASNELQLFDESESGNAYLSTQSEAIENASWEFLVKLDFNSSDQNFTEIYVSSNTSDLSGNVDGYFVRIGYSDDEVSLYKQSGTSKTKIIDGIDDRLNTSAVNVRVKLTRDDIGNWTLFSDTLGGTDYVTEGTVFDDTHVSSFYFGVKCTFTSTRWDKIFFDEFIVIEDNTPPELLSASIVDTNKLEVTFSEPCNLATTLNAANYNINNGIGIPDDVIQVGTSYSKVQLTYSTTTFSNILYTLVAENISDLLGNVNPSSQIDFQDNVNPEFESFEIINDTAIQMNFSEPMDATSSLDPMNYQINGGIGNPDALDFVEGSPDKIIMSFNDALSPNQEYTVLYQDLEDISGNTIESGSFSFAIVVILPEDIVFNEIMADPTPVIGLPENEYLELYNRRDLPVNIENWKLIEGSSETSFPSITIPANGYLIICDEDVTDEFSAYGNVLGIDISLTNGGENIQLQDNEDNLITSVNYTDEWYQDPNKDDGGWSIERIDPNNTCSGMSNWAASEDPNGGTPGTQNSIFGENIDTEAPEILSWELSSANEITLNFSEVPDTSTLFDYSNFYLTPDFGEPILITQSDDDPRAIRLQFVAAFIEDVSYTLTIENIADLCGNVMPNTEIIFINYIATHFDVLITEIMADPSPRVYLPDAEYVEFYNRAEYPVNLAGWKFSRGSTEVELPAIEIPVNGYVCITNRDYVDDFSGIENVYGVNDLPSLTNAYGELQLTNQEGTLIHFVNYSENWYESPTKQEGGWSLEMKDLNNPCAGSENWEESVSETGGTPGEANSISSIVSDENAPEIMRAIVHAPDTLRVYFNETLHPEFQPNPTNFNVNNSIGTPVTAERMPNRLDALELIFPTQFEAHTVYTLTMTDSITDCVGNQIAESLNTIFALPDSLEPQDIVINEILFNPLAGGSDYVELYNRSEKFINLSDLRIATRDDSLMIDKVNLITETGFMIFPGEHVVISEDIAAVESDYYCQNPQLLLAIEDLPSYTNASGRAVLCTRNLQVIDEMYYHEDWHFQLLREVKGVSLERIDYEQPAADENNWHSASESVGFGTPTYKNSQYRPYGEYENEFTLSPESISPDNDGYQDFLNIHYTMEKSGVVLSVTIYDAAGHLIRNLTENELLGAEGVIQWDGLTNNGQHPGAGIYIVLLDYFDLQGNRQQEKHTCVVAVMR